MSEGAAADIAETSAKESLAYPNGLPYFHRELSAEDKAILGSNAPTRLNAEEAAQLEAANRSQSGGSAWNSGGTWEEKDKSSWGRETLKGLLSAANCDFGGESVAFSAVKVDGDATIAVVRGRPRYLYDFKVELKWRVVDGEKTYKGKLEIPELDNECGCDGSYELQVSYDDRPSGKTAQELHKCLTRGSVKQGVCDAVGAFEAEFHAQR